MTGAGEFRLRRHSAVEWCAALLLCLVLSACASVPASVSVPLLDILDGDSLLYAAFPADADRILMTEIVAAFVPGLAPSHAASVAERIDVIYAGVGQSDGTEGFQLAASAAVPGWIVPGVFSRKNGWRRSVLKTDGGRAVSVYSGYGTEISFPDSGTVCAGRNAAAMAARYVELSAVSGVPSGETAFSDGSWLSGAPSAGEIRFEAARPQQLLAAFGMERIAGHISVARGSLEMTGADGVYGLSVFIGFKDEKFLRAGRTLVMLALGLPDGCVKVAGSDGLEITGMRIRRERLLEYMRRLR